MRVKTKPHRTRTTPITFRVADDEKAALVALAIAERTSVTALLRGLIIDHAALVAQRWRSTGIELPPALARLQVALHCRTRP